MEDITTRVILNNETYEIGFELQEFQEYLKKNIHGKQRIIEEKIKLLIGEVVI